MIIAFAAFSAAEGCFIQPSGLDLNYLLITQSGSTRQEVLIPASQANSAADINNAVRTHAAEQLGVDPSMVVILKGAQ